MNGLNAFERQYRTTGALAMIAQSVADILNHHVKLAVEGIDRMYLNIYVPKLQHEQGIVWFFREHRGLPVPSAAVMSPMSRNFVAKLEGYAAQHEVPLVQFRKGPAQGRRDGRASAQIPTAGRRGLYRQGAGEDAGIPHRETQEPEDRAALSLDRAFDRDGQSLLRLRVRPRAYNRLLRPGLAAALPKLRASDATLKPAFDKIDEQINAWINQAKLTLET